MKWTSGSDNNDVVDARGRRPSGGMMVGGGLGTMVIVVIVARLFGVDISGLLGGGGGGESAPTAQQQDQQAPPTGPDPDADLVKFVKFVVTDVEDTYAAMFKADGKQYERAKVVLFSQAIDTGCGRSTSAVGPFYCPADHHAYIDLSFYRELKQRFGAPGDFAQAYVLAHELGHHVQNLLGIEANMQKLGRGHTRNEQSVRLELQADCFAGVWGHSAQARKILEAGDLEEALAAATSIGDDRLQKQGGGEVNPETFTHGTSAQRVKWFRRGFDAGAFSACDTFGATDL